MTDSPAINPINRVEDMSTADDFNRKHSPTITATKVDDGYEVVVHTGKDVPHPSVPDHWINWLDVRVGDASIARFELSHLVAPCVKFHVALDAGTKITAISSCNIHGLWAADLVLA